MQVVRPELLRRGFEHVAANNLAVTDDVSIIEALGLPVRVTPGSYTNIKVQQLSCCRPLPSACRHRTCIAWLSFTPHVSCSAGAHLRSMLAEWLPAAGDHPR